MANMKIYRTEVIDILKREGLYKLTINDFIYSEINRRISYYFVRGYSTHRCAAEVAREVFNVVEEK
jgi:hypothetical protein